MHPFAFSRADDLAKAIAAHAMDGQVAFIAGGTDLLGLMKDRAALPERLLDINGLPDLARIEALPDGGLRIGALARMSEVAADMEVRRRFPVIAESLLFAASGQLRNMASIGGNLMQRTRCAYFRDDDAPPCNKRSPGSGCSARHGLNRNHRLPDNTPERDTVLGRGDLIVAVEVPARVEGRASHYLKVRDRESYEFALVSVAAAVAVDGKHIRSARLAMGGVAHKPCRLAAAEAALRGVSLDEADALSAAIAQSFADARPLAHNGFKVELAKRAALRALQIAGGRK